MLSKSKAQAGFREDFRTIGNVFILRALIDKQRLTRQKGKLFAALQLQECVRYCTVGCAVAGTGGTWCLWENPGYHHISVCT